MLRDKKILKSAQTNKLIKKLGCIYPFTAPPILVMDQIAKTIQKFPDAPKCSGTLQDAPNIMQYYLTLEFRY